VVGAAEVIADPDVVSEKDGDEKIVELWLLVTVRG